MRISKLVLKNFRNHRNSVLEIGDSALVVIMGRNWSGKTSVRQGLSMCLTPSTEGLDTLGREFISKIRRGEQEAVIIADIQTKRHLMQRTVTLSATAAGRSRKSVSLSDPDWNPFPFDKKLDEEKAALSVALNTEAFIRMDEKDQKNLLAGMALPSHFDFPPGVTGETDTILGIGAVNWYGEPFAAINMAYKRLFDERQIVNRQVREFAIPEPLAVPEGADFNALQDQLTNLRIERKRREAERDGAVEQGTKVNAEFERIKKLKANLLSAERLAEVRSKAEGKGELDRLNKEKKEAEVEIDEILRVLGKLEEVPDEGATCPTCQQFIDRDNLKAVSEGLQLALKNARDRQLALHQQVKGLTGVEEALKLLASHESAAKALEPVKDKKQPPLFDFGPYDRSIAECDAEIEKVTAQLRPVIAAEERVKEIALRKQQLVGLEEKAMVVDQLVKYFDKDGIKAKLLSEYIGGFVTKLNEVMSAWGYSCVLSIEPYTFEVTNARGDTIPVKELSGAERVMFSWAFQCAVSWTASLGLVVIDEVAMFLAELRPVLYARLDDMIQHGYLEQVIVLVADSSEEVPRLEGGAFFLVDEGTVRPLPILNRKETENERRADQRVVA